MKKKVMFWLLSLVLCTSLSINAAIPYSGDASSPATSAVVMQEKEATVQHTDIANQLKTTLEQDKQLKHLVERSIRKAAAINPDKQTNPAQSLDEFYDFIDYSLTRMPWNILPDSPYPTFATKCDQSILYAYFLLDQPLQELQNQGLFYNSVEYLQPIYTWLTDYNNAWRTYLDSPQSWKDEYYHMLEQDPTWNLDKGWYEPKSNWHSFNDFFSRKLSSPAMRPIAAPKDEAVVMSPADSLPQGVWQINANTGKFMADPIKNEEGLLIKSSFYCSIEQMLGEKGQKFAPSFYGGVLTHSYLNYDDYHRYHAPVSGTVVAKYIVPYANAVGGVVYWDANKQLYVLESNSLSWQAYETRGCIIIDTGNGLVAMLPIGMGQVSSVNFTKNVQVGKHIEKGDEVGYFLFGGSDCVMIFSPETKFQLTAKAGGTGSYSNGYAHLLCGEEYGIMQGMRKHDQH